MDSVESLSRILFSIELLRSNGSHRSMDYPKNYGSKLEDFKGRKHFQLAVCSFVGCLSYNSETMATCATAQKNKRGEGERERERGGNSDINRPSVTCLSFA